MAIIYKGSSLGICTTPQVGAKTQSELAALTYVDVCCVQEMPAFRIESNVISGNCIDGTKLTANGFPAEVTADLSVAYTATCVGHDTLRANIGNQSRFAMKVTLTDGVPDTTTPSIVYVIVKVSAGSVGGNGGGGEDWVVDEYTLLQDQDPILVKPTAIP